MEKVNVIKVGGAIVEDPSSLGSFLEMFAAVPGKKVLVHGGGRTATAVAGELGIESRMVQGRRITDEAMLRVVTMVYGGLVNKNVVARLQSLGIDAAGFTGADLDLVRSSRRPAGEVDYGFVGDVEAVRGEMLAKLLDLGVVPVLAPLTHDGQGHLLNTNADTIVSAAAAALSAFYDVTLTFCFEKPGVLAPDGTVIEELTEESFREYVSDGTVSGGMVPKIENALGAIRAGVSRVVVTSASDLCGGTLITA